jgi:hypothetical protein
MNYVSRGDVIIKNSRIVLHPVSSVKHIYRKTPT